MWRDARSLPLKPRSKLRRMAVTLVADGCSMTEVGEPLGVARETVGRWVKAQREREISGLVPGSAGPAREHEGHRRAADVDRRARRGNHPDQFELLDFVDV